MDANKQIEAMLVERGERLKEIMTLLDGIEKQLDMALAQSREAIESRPEPVRIPWYLRWAAPKPVKM